MSNGEKQGPHRRGTLGLSVVGSPQLSKLCCKRDNSEAAGYLTAPDHLLLLVLGSEMSHVDGGRPAWRLKISVFQCIFLCLSAFSSCRTLGQHGGVHVHDPTGYTWWGLLPSCARPASGPLFVGPASKFHWEDDIYTVPFNHIPFTECKESICSSIFLEKLSLGNTR